MIEALSPDTDDIGPEARTDERIRRAIHELREELTLWIDTQLDRLQPCEHHGDLAVPEPACGSQSTYLGMGAGYRVATRPSGDGARLGPSESAPAIRAAAPSDRGTLGVRNSDAEISEAIIAGSAADPEAITPGSSSRQRLDALARILDRRLKEAEGAAGAANGATGGRGPREGPDRRPGGRGVGWDSESG